jgi:hypothetical protein
MVSRDRSRTFRLAIERANDSIIQISDRFHLVHNLGFLLDRVLAKESPAKIRSNNFSSHPMESSNDVSMYLYNRCDCQLKRGKLFERAYFHQEQIIKLKTST